MNPHSISVLCEMREERDREKETIVRLSDLRNQGLIKNRKESNTVTNAKIKKRKDLVNRVEWCNEESKESIPRSHINTKVW